MHNPLIIPIPYIPIHFFATCFTDICRLSISIMPIEKVISIIITMGILWLIAKAFTQRFNGSSLHLLSLSLQFIQYNQVSYRKRNKHIWLTVDVACNLSVLCGIFLIVASRVMPCYSLLQSSVDNYVSSRSQILHPQTPSIPWTRLRVLCLLSGHDTRWTHLQLPF